MQQRLSIITLGTHNLARAREFYQTLGWQEQEPKLEDIAFFQLNGIALGLYPFDKMAEDRETELPTGFKHYPNVTLAYNVNSEAEVQPVIDEAVRAGGTEVKKAQKAFWGGFSGYFADPDGHLWEVAHNPFSPVDENGNFILGGCE